MRAGAQWALCLVVVGVEGVRRVRRVRRVGVSAWWERSCCIKELNSTVLSAAAVW